MAENLDALHNAPPKLLCPGLRRLIRPVTAATPTLPWAAQRVVCPGTDSLQVTALVARGHWSRGGHTEKVVGEGPSAFMSLLG